MLSQLALTLFARHPYPLHFTASGIVLHNDHVLLMFHKRIGAWVPPGGHVESDELPEETAVREIMEETGVPVRILSAPTDEPADKDAFFLAQPAFVQCVSAHEKAGDFYHLDLAYACVPVGEWGSAMPPLSGNDESERVAWVELSSLGKLPLARNVEAGVQRVKDLLARLPLESTAASYNK